MIFESLKKFIYEKIFHKKDQKLLMMVDENSSQVKEVKIDFSSILTYIEKEKYTKEFSVSFTELESSVRKKLMKKLNNIEKSGITSLHDDYPLVEGVFSQEHFISVRRKNVKLNKVGQTIVTENLYIDISTKRKHKNSDNYVDLQYKEIAKKGDVVDEYVYDQENESYYRKIIKNGVMFLESASYGNEQKVQEIEILAQPTNDESEVREYMKITGLSYIANNEKYHISNSIKSDPYVVNIQLGNSEKNDEIANKIEIIKVFKSKKECIVGYRPEMILIRKVQNGNEENKMFRLLQEGLYADNSSFKSNFEDNFTISKISLDKIESISGEIPFGLSDDTKRILRNGLPIQNHIKTIYEKGLEKILK